MPITHRNLKIEERGDFFRRKTFPMVRLKGQWLRAAGFESGTRLALSVISPGIIELRSIPHCASASLW